MLHRELDQVHMSRSHRSRLSRSLVDRSALHVSMHRRHFTIKMIEGYSFPDGPPGTTLARARLGTARQGAGTIGTEARRAVPDSATVPSWQPRHDLIRSETCRAVLFGLVALQCPCQPRR